MLSYDTVQSALQLVDTIAGIGHRSGFTSTTIQVISSIRCPNIRVRKATLANNLAATAAFLSLRTRSDTSFSQRTSHNPSEASINRACSPGCNTKHAISGKGILHLGPRLQKKHIYIYYIFVTFTVIFYSISMYIR